MTLPEARTISIGIDHPYRAAYRFLRDPANFVEWASGLADGLTRTVDGWIANTPEGPLPVDFSEPNTFGILDHTVHPADRPPVHVPMRVIPNGRGCEVLLTLLRQPDMSDADFERDAAWIARDLAALKALLEA